MEEEEDQRVIFSYQYYILTFPASVSYFLLLVKCLVKRVVFKTPAIIMNGANPRITRVSIQEYTNAITDRVNTVSTVSL